MSAGQLPSNRGGQGGRQARPKLFSEAEAISELLEAFGNPERSTHQGANMYLWWSASGTGAIFARLSSYEVAEGAKAGRQVAEVLDMVTRAGLQPRLIVLTVENSGFRRFEDRPDFQLNVRLIEETDWLEWVAWRDVDRVARDYLPGYTYFDHLRQAQIDIWMHQLRRPIDWETDDAQINALLMAAKTEGTTIKRRTHGMLKDVWLEGGRGWPGAVRYATRRDPLSKLLVPDPEQFAIVRWLHEEFSQAEQENRKSGARVLAESVSQVFPGVKLSASTVNRLLRDPIYATGEWYTIYEGEAYQGRTIQWANPIPLGIYQRNLQLLRLRRGPNTRCPAGYYALNGLLVHQRCMDLRVADNPKAGKVTGRRYALYGRFVKDKPTKSYYHAPLTPACCKGFAVRVNVIEPLVMRQLRRLIDHPELLREWEHAPRDQGNDLSANDVPTAEQLEQLRQEEARLARQLDTVVERQIDAVVDAEGDIDLNHYGELVAGLRRRLAATQARVRKAEQARTQPQPSADLQIEVGLPESDKQQLRERMCALLTDHVPEDRLTREARAALVQTLLTKVEVADHGDALTVRLHSWLVPADEITASGTADGHLEQTHAGDRLDPVNVAWTRGRQTRSLRETLLDGLAQPNGLAGTAGSGGRPPKRAQPPPEARGGSTGGFPTGSQGTPCKTVGKPIPAGPAQRKDHPELAPLRRLLQSDRGFEATESRRTGGTPRGLANKRQTWAGSWSDLHYGGFRRYQAEQRGGRPAWISPPIPMRPSARCGNTEASLAAVERSLECAAERLPATCGYMRVDWYAKQTDLDETLLDLRTVKLVARQHGTTFRALGRAALRRVRAGTDLPVHSQATERRRRGGVSGEGPGGHGAAS
jgi:hypothetical protein